MKKSRLVFNMFMVAALVMVLSGGAQAKSVSFKFAHFIPPNEPGAQVGVWIEKDLKENAKGLVKCKYFHSKQMGSTIEIVKKVRMGTLQAGFLTGNYAPDLDSKFGIGTLAYCMNSYEKWNSFLKKRCIAGGIVQFPGSQRVAGGGCGLFRRLRTGLHQTHPYPC